MLLLSTIDEELTFKLTLGNGHLHLFPKRFTGHNSLKCVSNGFDNFHLMRFLSIICGIFVAGRAGNG